MNAPEAELQVLLRELRSRRTTNQFINKTNTLAELACLNACVRSTHASIDKRHPVRDGLAGVILTRRLRFVTGMKQSD